MVKIGRLKSNEFIKDYFKKNTKGITYQHDFFQKALKQKIYYLSFKNFKIKNHFSEIESLGKDIDEIKYKIDQLLKSFEKPVKNIKNLDDREKLFFDKLGGFCCFYNSFIWLDRYILEPNKKPTNHLNLIARLLNGSSIKNLIIITRDPYAENPKFEKFKDTYKSKQECVRDYLNMIDQAIYPNQIFVQLFIVIPEELQKIHARYASWANLHDYDDLDNSSLDHLNNQIKVSIQPDKGAGYFEDQTDYGFSAQFNYSSADVVNDYISDLIEAKPLKEYKSYKYWLKENYPSDKVWIHHNEILRKDGLPKN